jgi:hypothetical protein
MASKRGGKRGGKKKAAKRKGKRKSKSKTASPMGLAAKLRVAFAEGLVPQELLTLSQQTTLVAAKALSGVKGEKAEQKLVRGTGKILLSQNKMGKRR